MEQMSFDTVSAESPLDMIFNIFRGEFVRMLDELGDMREGICVKKNRAYLSIQAKSSVAARIVVLKRGIRLEVKEKHTSAFPGLEFEQNKDGMFKVLLPGLSELMTYSDALCKIAVTELMSHAGEGFGCCSLYEKCSDALRCVQPMQFFSLACAYRKNLEQGRIFYGKNRNV